MGPHCLVPCRYLQNLKINASVWSDHHHSKMSAHQRDDLNCMHINTTLVHNHTFAKALHEGGNYTVGLFGKWLNNCPFCGTSVPAGFDAWFANGGGNYIAPQFHVRNLEQLGFQNGHWQGGSENYSTAVIGNVSVAWIRSVLYAGSQPFFAFIAPKAAHEPYIPAPWHTNHWDPTWPLREPRTPNWNCTHAARAHHHGSIASAPMLSDKVSTSAV